MNIQKMFRRITGIDKREIDARKEYTDAVIKCFNEGIEFILRKTIQVPLAIVCDDVLQALPSSEVQTGYIPMDALTVRVLRYEVPKMFKDLFDSPAIRPFSIDVAVAYSIDFAYSVIQKDGMRYRTGCFPGILDYDKGVCEEAKRVTIQKISLIQTKRA